MERGASHGAIRGAEAVLILRPNCERAIWKNPKHEYRNTKQIINPKLEMFKTFEFEKLKFVSDFGFRISCL